MMMHADSNKATSRLLSTWLRSSRLSKSLKENEKIKNSSSDSFILKDSTGPMTLENNSSSSGTAKIQEPICHSSFHSFESNLPPVETSWEACKYLSVIFFLEFAIWGFATSYGVLLDFYIHSKFESEAGASFILPLVGTFNTGIICFLIPVITTITNVCPTFKFPITYIGLVVFLASVFLASFAQNSIHVLLTLGIGYGVGSVATYLPALSYLPGWFLERRGLANGIVFSGNGLGGLIFPVILQSLLPKGGAGRALQYSGMVLAVLCVTSVLIIKPRINIVPQNKIREGRFISGFGDLTVFKNVHFWCFLASNTFQSVASYLPGLYLPNYAHAISLGPSSCMILLAIINVSGIFSKIIFGMLSDHFSPYLIGCCTSAAATASVLGIWGGLGSRGLGYLVMFAIIYGGTSGCWTTLYLSRIQRLEVDESTTMTLYGAYSMSRGFGNIVAGPISSSLIRLKFPGPSGTGFAASGSYYSSLILFCGIAMALTTVLEGYVYSKTRSRGKSLSKPLA